MLSLDYVPIFCFFAVMLLVIFFLVTAQSALKRIENNNRPIVRAEARVVAKRLDVNKTSATYYVTFEVSSGARHEFRLPGKDYGLLAEGDQGVVAYQGTRYRGFQRVLIPR